MRRKRTLVALLLLGLLALPARAFTFTDELFSIEIPEGEKTYYYTQRGTNMTGTMLENAQKQDMLCLIGSYSEAGTLQYTFKVETRYAGGAEELARSLQGELSASYQLSQPVEEIVAGAAGWSMSGQSVQNSNYAVKIYVVGAEPSAVLTTMYQPSAEGELLSVLNSVQWSSLPTTDPDMVRDPDAIPLPGVSQPVEKEPVETQPPLPDPQPLEPVDEGKEDVWGEVKGKALGLWEKYHLQLLIGAAVTVMGLLLLNRTKRNKGKRAATRGKRRGYAPKHAK